MAILPLYVNNHNQTDWFDFISRAMEHSMSRVMEASGQKTLKVVEDAPEPASDSTPSRPDPTGKAEPATANPSPKSSGIPSRRRLVLIGAGILALAYGALQARDYWTTGRFMVSTDDAYVGAELAQVSPRLAAPVAEVLITANQSVKAGDILVRLDQTDYRTALAQAEARLATQKATIDRIRAQAVIADAGIAQAQATLAGTEAEFRRASSALDRATKLSAQDYASKASFDTATADREKAGAQLSSAKAQIDNAVAQRALADAQLKEAQRGADDLAISVAKARSDLAFTEIKAPLDGVVAAKNVQVGDFAAVGKRILSIVPLDRIYIDANFKETQLGRVAPGEEVTVRVDAYPDQVFMGKVIELAPATGSTFSLLPPDNATGNFTKIVQRVPIRIAVTQPPDQAPLRPGMSVVATIDTRTMPAR
jgi:membrane fusion protein, multidrug efflux system